MLKLDKDDVYSVVEVVQGVEELGESVEVVGGAGGVVLEEVEHGWRVETTHDEVVQGVEC